MSVMGVLCGWGGWVVCVCVCVLMGVDGCVCGWVHVWMVVDGCGSWWMGVDGLCVCGGVLMGVDGCVDGCGWVCGWGGWVCVWMVVDGYVWIGWLDNAIVFTCSKVCIVRGRPSGLILEPKEREMHDLVCVHPTLSAPHPPTSGNTEEHRNTSGKGS